MPREHQRIRLLKAPGHLVRRTYQEGSGVPCLYAVKRSIGDTESCISMELWYRWAAVPVLETNFKSKLKLTSSVNKLYCAAVLLNDQN